MKGGKRRLGASSLIVPVLVKASYAKLTVRPGETRRTLDHEGCGTGLRLVGAAPWFWTFVVIIRGQAEFWEELCWVYSESWICRQ